jgi:hypothetical protein
MSDADRIQIAARVNAYMQRKGYPDLAGPMAPPAAVVHKECRTHGIMYSCSKCGWNHCSECNSSEVVNGIGGVSGWTGRCSRCHVRPGPQLGTARLSRRSSSAEYGYLLQLIHRSLALGSALYASAPFQAHGIPVRMRCGLRIHDVVRHTSEGAVARFASAAAQMHELRAMRAWDHGLPPIEEYPIFVGCCRDEAARIALRGGFCPFYTGTHDGDEGVIFGSCYFQYAMAQADRGAASLRMVHPIITPARRYVCIARALTGRLEQVDKADRRVSPAADSGGDADGWVRAYFDAAQLKLEYVVTYDVVDPAAAEADVVVEWGAR